MAFAVSAKMLKTVQVFVTTFLVSVALDPGLQYRVSMVQSLRVCLLHM